MKSNSKAMRFISDPLYQEKRFTVARQDNWIASIRKPDFFKSFCQTNERYIRYS